MMMAKHSAKMRAADYARDYAGYMRAGIVETLGHRLTIGAGNDDRLSVYYDRESVYILAENSGLEYIGLEVFDRETGEKIGDAFCQADGWGDDDRATVERLLSWAYAPRKIRFMLDYIG